MTLSAQFLGKLEPIRGLSSQRLEELSSLCQPERFPLGSDPLQRASGAGQLVYLVKGELKVVLPDGSMRVLVGGCDTANWPIGYKTVAPVSSKAITETELIRLDFDLLDIMMTWDELAGAAEGTSRQAPDEATQWRTLSGAFSVQSLTGSSLGQLPPAHIHELLLRFERIKVKRGQVLIREGDEGDFYYLIESGRAEVTRQVGGAKVTVAELKSGDGFGEEALVSEARRNASVTMKTDGVLLRLGKADFIELMRAPLLHAIGLAEAERRVAEEGALWLDVRYAAEFSQDGRTGALNVPLNEIRTAFSILDKKREYITYCSTGRRSSAAAFLLAQHGFKASWLDVRAAH